ncbi:PI31 proteasome regulator N-terminal-domain-containing protein [Ephemerocybe angulata]|uniref:PI31 proteasome regulator N-terminal-domain-containing protein n=1 Tax=Ephemerocybe angulata TaxID=980116 RepID=A0A8H6ID91_9AGAR|nr:PI31 proteasome regulator N-terminal-domain-containing protein [Tulosesus angulatus]
MSNILDASALISLLPTLLPENAKTLACPQDGLAALIHSAFTALAFRLIAVNDSTSEITSGNILPPQWNKNGPGDYSFKYRHDQSSLEFLIKVSKLGTRTVVNAIAIETDKVASLDLCTDDFTSPSFYPHDLAQSAEKPLIHGFISSNRLKIIQKLIPGLQKEVPTSAGSQPSTSRDPTPARPQAGRPPNAPDYDPYGQSRPYPPRNPLEIGRSDLDPFPPQSVLPSFPLPSRRDRNDPQQGPWGGDGARFDPVGPAPPNRPPRGPFPPGGGNLRDPDNDEFMPPGMGMGFGGNGNMFS